jgi:putative spermidine/putrescine transport system substrate-binding protein
MNDLRKSTMPGGLSRRALFQAMSVTGLASLAGAPRAHAADTNTLVIEGFGGSWADKVQEAYIKPFKAENPNAKVVFVGESDDGVILSKMLLGCGRPDFAVSDVNTNVGPLMLDHGCVAGYEPDLIPNLKYIAAEAVLTDPTIGPYYASSYLGILGLVWNTKLAKKPTSWDDLWNPQYKGKVAIGDFAWTGQDWLPAISRLHGGSEDNVGPGIDAIADLVKKQQAVIVGSSDQMIKLFQSEAIVMAPFWNGRTGAMQRHGVPVAIEFVPNSIFIGDGYLIMKGTPALELAQRWVNVTIDGQHSLDMAELSGYPPSDTRVKLTPEMLAIRGTAKELKNVIPIDWSKVAKNRDANLQLWDEKIKG